MMDINTIFALIGWGIPTIAMLYCFIFSLINLVEETVIGNADIMAVIILLICVAVLGYGLYTFWEYKPFNIGVIWSI